VAESAQPVVSDVGERHVAGAEIVHLPQHRERIVDLMSAFDADERGDLAGAVNPAHVCRGVGDLEVRRIAGGHALDQIDLLERHLHGLGALHVDGHPHRPELSADMPGAQAHDVGHERRHVGRRRQLRGVGFQIDGSEPAFVAVADLPRKIVVAVDERRLLEHLEHPRTVIRAGGPRRRGARRDGKRDQGGSEQKRRRSASAERILHVRFPKRLPRTVHPPPRVVINLPYPADVWRFYFFHLRISLKLWSSRVVGFAN
jgi:hypothetical protein